ncbi:hypothetical protein EV714DRAFT_249192 [Schizophyllum commune]
MASVKLYLRPPPNVDFVDGYPGIPPGPSRPQAAVKGAIEVRPQAQGQVIKAKWIRIELRKVETLPGGGQSNTFFDFVGPSPVTLWQSDDEYGTLRSGDFPFAIRIPESIPPSIQLGDRAGIRYELVATLCVQGKKGFLRRKKSVTVSEMASVIIDKHEIHSTWPVYCQPESRTMPGAGVTLVVERNRTCYGPGDRISVLATLKSDSLSTVILRGFELALEETTIFRPGSHGKRAEPITRKAIISENKFAVNATLYGGQQHMGELTCAISPNHTTTSLNAARHIDITYVLIVRALMGTGTHITMPLPIVVSNWQRNVSYEALRRIGPVPSLSLQQQIPQPAQPTFGGHQPSQSISTLDISPANNPRTSLSNDHSAYGTAPSASNRVRADEFGYAGNAAKPATYGGNSRANNASSRPGSANGPGSNTVTPAPSGRRPQSARSGSNAGNRFTIMNALPSEIPTPEPEPEPPLPPVPVRTPSPKAAPVAVQTPPKKVWPSAEDEKAKLYSQARAQVERVQGKGASPPPVQGMAPPVQTVTPRAVSTSPKPNWPSAEDEKAKLFESARAKVERVQGALATSPNPITPSPSPPNNIQMPQPQRGQGSSTPWPSAEEEKERLFNEAKNKAMRTQGISSPGLGFSAPAPAPHPNGNGFPNGHQGASSAPRPFLTAEQEKERLYQTAQAAVQRTQQDIQSPAPYETLYPAGGSSSSQAPPPPAAVSPPTFDHAPPSFEHATSPPPQQPKNALTALQEKQQLARQWEENDRRAQEAAQDLPPSFEAVTASSASAPMPAPPSGMSSAMAEKEAMKRKWEAQDAAAAAAATPSPPPRKTTASPGARPPLPTASGPRMMSAAEEKAMMQARYAAEDAAAGGSSGASGVNGYPASNGYGAHGVNGYAPNGVNGMNGHSPSPPMPVPVASPPPLAPKPPREYIQETQEEDLRVKSVLASEDVFTPYSSLNPRGHLGS